MVCAISIRKMRKTTCVASLLLLLTTPSSSSWCDVSFSHSASMLSAALQALHMFAIVYPVNHTSYAFFSFFLSKVVHIEVFVITVTNTCSSALEWNWASNQSRRTDLAYFGELTVWKDLGECLDCSVYNSSTVQDWLLKAVMHLLSALWAYPHFA